MQLRLGADEQPELAVYSQHKTAEAKPWAATPKAGNRPLVHVARGSHANYFGPGSHFTGTWFDQADGKGPKVTPTLEIVGDQEPAWLHWPGHWGDTKEGFLPLDSRSPNSPAAASTGSIPQSSAAPSRRPHRRHPQPPKAVAHREGDHIVVDYEADPEASTLVVATRPKGSDEPAEAHAFPLEEAKGAVEVPAGDLDYDVWTSVVVPLLTARQPAAPPRAGDRARRARAPSSAAAAYLRSPANSRSRASAHVREPAGRAAAAREALAGVAHPRRDPGDRGEQG